MGKGTLWRKVKKSSFDVIGYNQPSATLC